MGFADLYYLTHQSLEILEQLHNVLKDKVNFLLDITNGDDIDLLKTILTYLVPKLGTFKPDTNGRIM